MPGTSRPSPRATRRGRALSGVLAGGLAAGLVAAPLLAQEAPAPGDLAALRAEIAALRADYEGRLTALESRLAQLAAGAAAAPPPPAEAAAPPTAAAAAAAANYFNPAMSLIGNFVAVGGHEASGDGAPSAELRESEMGLSAVVDPYARADFFLSFGEEGVEMEEGYATLTTLPANLLVRLGRMRAAFGKVNTLHSHTLPWADQPLPVANLLGSDEGWIGSGVSFAWLVPLGETFSEATLQAFRGEAEGLFEDDRRSDVAYNGRYRLFRDLTEATNLDVGLSYAVGPNGIGPGTDTRLGGLDLTLRWKPLRTALYRSAILRGELFRSSREEPEGDVDASGWFLAGDWQLARRWSVGGRYEASERPYDAALEDTGEAALVTFRPSDFSLLRAELRRRRFAEDDTATELFLQYQFAIGAHGAHPF